MIELAIEMLKSVVRQASDGASTQSWGGNLPSAETYVWYMFIYIQYRAITNEPTDHED